MGKKDNLNNSANNSFTGYSSSIKKKGSGTEKVGKNKKSKDNGDCVIF